MESRAVQAVSGEVQEVKAYEELQEVQEVKVSEEVKVSDVQEAQNTESDGTPPYAPLQFWFYRNAELALPLVALQWNEDIIDIIADMAFPKKFYQISELNFF